MTEKARYPHMSMEDVTKQIGKLDTTAADLAMKKESFKKYNEIEEADPKLSEWERDFLSDIGVRLEKDQFISERQLLKLRELHTKFCVEKQKW